MIVISMDTMERAPVIDVNIHGSFLRDYPILMALIVLSYIVHVVGKFILQIHLMIVISISLYHI